MNRMVWTRKRMLITIAVCAMLAVSSVMLLQTNKITEAALIDPHPGLVGWWSLDEGTGSLAEDSSGYGNDGAIYGASWVSGKYDEALYFGGDATSNYVEISDSEELKLSNVVFSISFWIKTSSTLTRDIICKRTGISNFYLVRLQSDGRIRVQVYDGANSIQRYSLLTVNDNSWHFITAVVDNGVDTAVYVDGTRSDGYSTINTLSNISPEGTVKIGKGDLSGGYVEASIDEVRVYDRALSAAEVQENYQKSPDFSSKLLAKVPKGTTQIISTLSWQGTGSINVTVESPTESYTEETIPVYQKTVYSTSGGTTSMLNIKRISISVAALSSDENWYIMLEYSEVEDYSITVETQK